ncbi:3-oxoacyl-(acyl-carrier-protein) reductase [Thermocrinis albus DSM 14484]|uniref:3-oxoacyl-[acyl-carrier-protein] reductase n=1 Tax=Thermocrinis albus (strain DSM 14484 / JCM 11386 / HI 11/12) TaxID=638303 RepID=D3SQ44_THEAH|nr:3-oxoacyl-[acyl-carrier-protein] reductase [Thermocrinis albus]ADC89281.1 3-oxoacyl-(acyl-carrier-protein) reductase [Thermocrinis albus DSM 14484]
MLCIDLQGKRALVTGATRGIGRAIAQALAQAGATVVVTGRERSRAQEVAERLPGEAIGIELRLEDPESIKRAYAEVEERLGGVDILVNNAGVTRDKLFLRMTLEDWDEVFQVNLRGTFIVTSLAVKGMVKNRWGRIINISSVVGFTGNIGQVNYSATKSALVGFTKSLAKELASRNITVNAVAPGFIETDMTSVLSEDIKQSYLKNIPLGRFGTPEDVAGIVVFLSSDLASYITGEIIHVNGGMY